MKKTIEEWIADYCAGTLTREEGEQLRQLLLHDSEARRFFRDAREAESLMRALEWDRRLDAREAWQRCLAAWKHRRQVRPGDHVHRRRHGRGRHLQGRVISKTSQAAWDGYTTQSKQNIGGDQHG